MKKIKILYTHQVCQHYKVPYLLRLERDYDYEVYGLFGQSHFKSSKMQSIDSLPSITEYKLLPTVDLYIPIIKRTFHIIWNPSLYGEIRKIKPDIIISGPGNFPNNRTIRRYCSKHNVPYIWHGLGGMYSHTSWLRKMLGSEIRRFIESADGGLAFNTTSRDFYLAQFNVKSARLRVAANVVDTDKILIERKRLESSVVSLKKSLGIEDCKVILFVGRIDPVKNLDRLINAFNKILNEVDTNVKLVIVGEGIEESNCKDLVKRIGISDQVLFVGRRTEDVDLYYMIGDLFVMPGLGGLAISHAMTHGLPVITAPADGTEQDLIEHGISGFLLDKNFTDETLADYCQNILADDSLAVEMGKNASKAIADEFGINKSVKIFDELIKDILKE